MANPPIEGDAPGDGTNRPGIRGVALAGVGVWGSSGSPPNSYGVLGTIGGEFTNPFAANGPPKLPGGTGVYGYYNCGLAITGPAIYGFNASRGDGVLGITGDSNGSGVNGSNSGGGNGVYGTSVSGNAIVGKSQSGNAGYFEGNVAVIGNYSCSGTMTVDVDIVLRGGADFAEDFDVQVSDHAVPGTVMVLDQNGALRPCDKGYDKSVAGVISGAGHYRPGLILDRAEPSAGRRPVALVGKVFCKVDAASASIEIGDLLTTSQIPGHAMKASDPQKAFGCVIGKALRALASGRDLIPILVSLQ